MAKKKAKEAFNKAPTNPILQEIYKELRAEGFTASSLGGKKAANVHYFAMHEPVKDGDGWLAHFTTSDDKEWGNSDGGTPGGSMLSGIFHKFYGKDHPWEFELSENTHCAQAKTREEALEITAKTLFVLSHVGYKSYMKAEPFMANIKPVNPKAPQP